MTSSPAVPPAESIASCSESVAHSGGERMVRLAQPQGAEIAAQLIEETGMSPRAAASALGVDQRTVRRDLASRAANAAPPDQSVTPSSRATVGLDGKVYPATQPPRPPRPAPEPGVVEAELVEGVGYASPYRHRTPWPAVTPAPGPWARQGACADLPEHVSRAFIADEPTDLDELAIASCQRCPVRVPCADYADTARVVCGIWGGRRRRPADLRQPRPA